MPISSPNPSLPQAAPPVLTLSRDEMRARALAFAKRYAGPQREESEAKSFLDEFFNVFGRDRHAIDAVHEYRVPRPDRGDGRIDLLWSGKLLVEMKSTGRDLAAAAQQAFDYLPHLDPETAPRWVLVSDFARFVLHDLGEDVHDYLQGLAPARTGKRAPKLAAAFTLDELPQKLRHFAFIRDEEQALFQTQPDVNQKAVALLGELHDALKTSGYTGHALERLLVRVLFCLFAEDTDIFPWNAFTRLVENSARDGSNLGERLARLFQTLDTPAPSRSPHLTADLRAFPYVNGSLFSERLDLADTTAAHRAALLQCCRFDWSRISPGIFGSLFQGVMEPRERRAKGAHYTSEENIRRVIDPLFLDNLRAEFDKIRAQPVREKRLQQFHDRIAKLRFLDPACGCGNFLVVAYRELRALELDVLRALHGDQLALGLEIGDIARVNVDQFYGIEIEEFPARIAETALWLTDHQVNMTFSKAFGKLYTRIPLKKSPTIVHDNALRRDWTEILPAKDCAYIMGNPPFVGKHYQAPDQRQDMTEVFKNFGNTGDLDYVSSWYMKAADYIKGTAIRCAFVSTNSISQGEQVPVLWALLFRKHIKIHFAHRTFTWRNEASGKAHVHCVVIGFGIDNPPVKRLYDYPEGGAAAFVEVTNISPYLTPGPDTFVVKQSRPLGPVPEMRCGNKPTDDGNFIFTDPEKRAFLDDEPDAKKYFRRFTGSEEFINGNMRWCLWLKDAKPEELRALPKVMECVNAVREFRKRSTAKPTQAAASRANEFFYINQPQTRYILIPEVSSEKRDYIPIGFMSSEIVSANTNFLVASDSIYLFGILTSKMHMAWMRTVAGRLKSDFRYSGSMVYNTYPWPEPNTKQRAAIEAAAQTVLDARSPHLKRGASLADLYDPLAMPAALLKAHQTLDHAVDKSYRPAPFLTDRERVEYLFTRYEQLSTPLLPVAKKERNRKTKPTSNQKE